MIGRGLGFEGMPMGPNIVTLYAIVIMLFTMLYFLPASVAFLFVKLDIPVVARLLRGLFSVGFLLIAGAGGIAVIAFAATGAPAFAIGASLIVVFTIAARRWFLRHMDAHWSAVAAGSHPATRRLRLLHCAGMATTFVQIVAVVSSVPLIA